MIEIDNIQVYLQAGHATVRALASARIAGVIVLTGMRVVEGKKGIFLSMPARQDDKGEYHDIYFPTSRETRGVMETMVLSEYRRVAQ